MQNSNIILLTMYRSLVKETLKRLQYEPEILNGMTDSELIETYKREIVINVINW